MTHEERAREILASFCQWLENHGYVDDDWWIEEPKAVDRYLAQTDTTIRALASAEKKGRELHPQERDTVFALGLQQGWNEAIEAARKVAESVSGAWEQCGYQIAESINKLKRG